LPKGEQKGDEYWWIVFLRNCFIAVLLNCFVVVLLYFSWFHAKAAKASRYPGFTFFTAKRAKISTINQGSASLRSLLLFAVFA
jgi:hypothetical protein